MLTVLDQHRLDGFAHGVDPWMGVGPCGRLRYITKNADIDIGLSGLSEINFEILADMIYESQDFIADFQFSKLNGSRLKIKPGLTSPYVWFEAMPAYRVWARCPVPITPSLTVSPEAGLGRDSIFSMVASYNSDLVTLKGRHKVGSDLNALEMSLRVHPWHFTVVSHLEAPRPESYLSMEKWWQRRLTIQGKYGMVGYIGEHRVITANLGPVTFCASWSGRFWSTYYCKYKFASVKHRSDGKSISFAFLKKGLTPLTLWAKYKARISDRLTCGMRIRMQPENIGMITLCPYLTLTSDS